MTIFRSKPRTQRILVTNGRNVDFHILSEPWANQLTLKPSEILELICDSSELEETDNPLNFEVWDDGTGASIWWPASTTFRVVTEE